MIPIFDALAHPTLTGRWLDSDKVTAFLGVP
jgi:hypothetical protein